MIQNKEEFIKNFLPESVENIDITHINLDIADLSLADIFRNLNRLYPKNSRNRIAMEQGELAVGILCKTETLDPYNGLFLIFGKKDMDVNVVSSKYIVFAIDEDRLTSDTKIEVLVDDITNYLIHNFYDDMRILPEFYKKFVYDPDEFCDGYESEPY